MSTQLTYAVVAAVVAVLATATSFVWPAAREVAVEVAGLASVAAAVLLGAHVFTTDKPIGAVVPIVAGAVLLVGITAIVQAVRESRRARPPVEDAETPEPDAVPEAQAAPAVPPRLAACADR